MPAFLAASPLSLAEANERLYALRRQAQAQRQALPDMPGRTESLLPEQESSAAASITSLPAHLGWGSAPLTALLRRQAGIKTDTASVAGSAVAGEQDWGNEGGESANCYTKITQPSTQPVDWVKVYPDIGLAMLRQDMSAPGRLWLILRYIDKEGTGSITIDEAKEQLVGEGATLRLCGKRQWRNLLRDGEGVFWTRDDERLWLRSTAKIAQALGVERLTGRPVALPVTALLEGIGAFRAHLYTAFHSGRAKESIRGREVMPIARVTLAGLSGVGASSQRAYEKQTKLKVQRNFAVGEVATQENRENRAWVQGQAVFELRDYRGQQGPKGKSYLAWQLPNSYLGQHQHRPKGRQKRINRELKDLVMQGMPGNVEGRAETHPEKRYYPNGKEAARSCGRGQESDISDIYWQRQQTHNRQSVLWRQIGSS